MQHAGGYRPRDGALPVEWIVALPSSGSSRTISPPTCPRRRSKLRAQVRVWCVIGRKDAACAALMASLMPAPVRHAPHFLESSLSLQRQPASAIVSW